MKKVAVPPTVFADGSPRTVLSIGGLGATSLLNTGMVNMVTRS
jgi:hypothetical protein